MQPHVDNVYRTIWPGCTITRPDKEDGVDHELDRQLGIDARITLACGVPFTIQEKVRERQFFVEPRLRVRPVCPDFTQEHRNGVGTQWESPGEWFKLSAELYFYAWAQKDESGLSHWLMLNIPDYKMRVLGAGGLDAMGVRHVNNKHGRAEFFAIPVFDLCESWVAHSHPPGDSWAIPESVADARQQEAERVFFAEDREAIGGQWFASFAATQ